MTRAGSPRVRWRSAGRSRRWSRAVAPEEKGRGRRAGVRAGRRARPAVHSRGRQQQRPFGWVLNLIVAVAGTTALERLGVPRGADATDLPSRLTVRRRPETGANNP